MNGYVGHYMGQPASWFFVLASSPEDAIALVDGRWGEPDARSLKRVEAPLAFQFSASVSEDEEDEDALLVEAEAGPDSTLLDDEEVEDWIRERLALPFEGPAAEDFTAMNATLGERMPKEWKRAIHGRSPAPKDSDAPR